MSRRRREEARSTTKVLNDEVRHLNAQQHASKSQLTKVFKYIKSTNMNANYVITQLIFLANDRRFYVYIFRMVKLWIITLGSRSRPPAFKTFQCDRKVSSTRDFPSLWRQSISTSCRQFKFMYAKGTITQLGFNRNFYMHKAMNFIKKGMHGACAFIT